MAEPSPARAGVTAIRCIIARRRHRGRPPIRGSRIRCFATTDLGLVRPSNQDAAYSRLAGATAVLAVADGMGGAPAGDRASAIVIAAFEHPIAESDEPVRYLRDAVEHARRAIDDDVALHPERAGMGSTVVATAVRGGEAWVVHVGDSRAYLWQDGALTRLTEDHSVAAESVRSGKLDPAAVRDSPERHLLTRVVGGGGQADEELYGPLSLDGGSALLLVSDGVCGVIDDDEIAGALAEHRGGAVARALIERVHAAGAPDNLAVALLDERE